MKGEGGRTVLIAYAHEPEVETLKKLITASDFRSLVVWRRCGNIGGDILKRGTPRLIINLGFAGALNRELDLGAVVLIKNFPFEPAERFAKNRRIKTLSLITSDSAVLDPANRAALREQTGADIVDMEAHHLFKQTTNNNIPFVSFKIISDRADADAWDRIKRYRGKLAESLGEIVYDFIKFYLSANLSDNTGPQPS